MKQRLKLAAHIRFPRLIKLLSNYKRRLEILRHRCTRQYAEC